MRRRACIVLAILCAWAASAEETIRLKDLPALVLTADSAYISAEQAARYALHDSRASTAKALPQLDFSSQYGLGYVPRLETSVLTPLPTDATINDQAVHSLTTGVSVSQMLPTAGSLSLSVANAMSVSDYGEITPASAADYLDPFGNPQFTQNPSLTLRLDQPILLNGTFIDFDLFPATLRTASLGYQKAECARRAQSNQTVLQAVQLFLQVVQMRKGVGQTEKALAVAQGNLDNLQRSFALGSVAEADLLDQQIAFASQKTALLELKMNLKKAEWALAHSVGRETLDGVALEDDIPSAIALPKTEELEGRAMAGHPLIQQQALAAEEKRLMGVISGQKYASGLTLGFTFAPKYPRSTGSGVDMTFPTSFSRLFEEGWSQDFKLTAGLTIHLFDGGQAGESRTASDALAASAENALASQRRAVRDQLELAVLRKETLGERVPMLSSAVDLARRRLEAETNLKVLGKTTDLAVDAKKADYEAKQNDLWRARADLMLADLELASLSGEDIAALMQGSLQ